MFSNKIRNQESKKKKLTLYAIYVKNSNGWFKNTILNETQICHTPPNDKIRFKGFWLWTGTLKCDEVKHTWNGMYV